MMGCFGDWAGCGMSGAGVAELLVHGEVLLADAVTPPRRDAGVLIREGVIVEIGGREELRRAQLLPQ